MLRKIVLGFLATGLVLSNANIAEANDFEKWGKKAKKAVHDAAGISVGVRILRGEDPKSAVKGATKSVGELMVKPLVKSAEIEQKIEDAVTKRSKILGESLSITRLPQKISKQTIISGVTAAASGKPGDIIGAPLAGAIRQAELQYKGRAKPIPERISFLLSSAFTPEVLKGARYTVDKSMASIAGALNALKEKSGDNHAVTVNSIIVFANEPSVDDIWFWAHEIHHIVQYRRLGIEGFAARYTTKSGEMEEEANKAADRAVEEASVIIRFVATQTAKTSPKKK